MADDVPIAARALECNGTASPVISIIDQMAISAGTAAHADAESAAGPAPSKAAQEGSTSAAAEKTTSGSSGGERPCKGNQEENDTTQLHGAAEIPPQDAAADGQQSEEGPGRAGAPAQGTEQPEPRSTGLAGAGSEQSPAAGAPRPEAEEHPGDEAWPDGEEEEQEEDEEDTEEDEVQLIEIKKENSEESHVEKQQNGKEASPPASPTCNSQPEKPEEPPGAGKKNDISRHSYSRYNTISYRKIRKGNTKQRIDEFESMMHL